LVLKPKLRRSKTEKLDPDTRKVLDVKHELGDVQDVPDALRDEQASAAAQKKAVEVAPANKMVKGAKKK